ncbi:MAG: DMT family transporter [Alloprevotella sp.]|nr:DMT family transporter [Alloprevotella sp.]MBR1652820.1 DMT family transporter [Alloprevotella sp.]
MYYALAVVVCIFWGVTFVSTKAMLNVGLSPAMVFFLRFLVAYLAMLPLSHKRLWCDSLRDELMMVLGGVSGGSFFFLMENNALLYTQSANVSFITALPPLFLAIYSALRPGGESSWNIWIGALVAVLGLACFVVGADPESASNPLLGNALALVSTFLWCVYQLIVTPLSEHYGISMVTRKMFGYGTLTILPFVIMEIPELPAVLTTTKVWANLLFLGLVASCFCYYAWNVVMERIGSVKSSNYLYLNPFVTCIAAYLLLGEKVTPLMLLGGICTIAGVYLSLMNKARN